MEKHQIQPQSSEDNTYKFPGLWDKNWVRPYESIWSIFNTYKKVNVISSNAILMKSLGIRTSARTAHDRFLSYGIFCNISSNVNDFDKIFSSFVPEWYKTQLDEFTSKRDISDFFTDKISYCPECMKNGYHSIFHQLKGIKRCPFHPKTIMIDYLKERYILGSQSSYIGEPKKMERYKVFISKNMFIRKITDFEDCSQLPLPLDRKEIPEIEDFFTLRGFRKNFDYIKAIGSDLFDENIIPEIGPFLLDFELKPEIIIKDIKETDAQVIGVMNKRIRNSNLKCPKIADNLSRILFKYKYLQMFIKEKLRTYTYDEIDYKCYQIERGRFISYDDELGIILLYLLFLTGDERIEESLSIIRDVTKVSEKYKSGYQYYPSEICIHDLQISEFSIAAQYYVLEDYMNTNFHKFMDYVKMCGGMEKPLMRSDLILYPAHMIYVEENNMIKIYRY